MLKLKMENAHDDPTSLRNLRPQERSALQTSSSQVRMGTDCGNIELSHPSSCISEGMALGRKTVWVFRPVRCVP